MEKYLIALCVLITYCNDMFGQLSIGMLSSNSLVENAVSSGIVVIRTDYQLKDKGTGELYGKSGADFYGSSYCLGLITEAGVLMPIETANPWVSDPGYDKIKDKAQYEPVLSHREYLSLDNRVVNDNASLQTASIRDSSLLIDIEIKNGFSLVDSLTERDIYVVWVLQNTGKKSGDENAYKVSVQTKRISPLEIQDVLFQMPQLMQTLLGGYVFSCKNTGIGTIQFELIGLLKEQSNGFVLNPVFLSKNKMLETNVGNEEHEVTDDSEDNCPDELTPIKKKKVSKRTPNKEKTK